MARPPQDPQIRINEILDAAEPLFYEKGYHETAISDIVKSMGVAQGTVYYYFKSKDEILEGLMSRHIAAIVSEVEPLIYADSFTPVEIFNLVMETVFHTLRYKDGLLFDFLYNDHTMHLIDKLGRQGHGVMAPLLQKVIEKGIKHNYFQVASTKAALNIIEALIQCLIDVIYEKSSEELISIQFKLAEDLIGSLLGTPTGAIKLRIPV